MSQTHVGGNCSLGASEVESFLTSGKTTAVVAIVYEQSFPQSILRCLLHLYISNQSGHRPTSCDSDTSF